MNQLILCFFLMAIATYSFYRHMKFIQSRTLPKWKNAKKGHHHTGRFYGASVMMRTTRPGKPSYSVADNDSQALESAA